MTSRLLTRQTPLASVAVGLIILSGCSTVQRAPLPVFEAPRELCKITHPTYRIEPPDILIVDAVRVVPLPPYKISPMDSLYVQATGVAPAEPISGIHAVDPDGTINLGLSYGSVTVVDLSIEEARASVEKYLKKLWKDAQVTVSLAQSRALTQIRGEHLVRPDGTVFLGIYGSAYVAGLTLDEAKAAIELQLSRYLFRPEVSVDVGAYNSKVYYVITDGAGNGEQVATLPSTGNETVLDAIGKVGGLSAVSSKGNIWVARPAPPNCGAPDQILPVNWTGITRQAQTATNYQILPGDRVYVMSQPLITVDTYLGRLFAPIERTFGIILLGNGAVRAFSGNNTGNTGNTGGF